LGVTAVYIRKLSRDGWFEKSGRGKFNLRSVLAGMQGFWKDEARRSSKSAASSRVADAKSDLVHLQIEERSRKLVDEARAEALATCDVLIGGIRSDLVSLPARVTSDLALRQKIETAIDDVLRAAAKRAAHAATGVEEGGEPSSSVAEDDA
jgi:hypothetical protein